MKGVPVFPGEVQNRASINRAHPGWLCRMTPVPQQAHQFPGKTGTPRNEYRQLLIAFERYLDDCFRKGWTP